MSIIIKIDDLNFYIMSIISSSYHKIKMDNSLNQVQLGDEGLTSQHRPALQAPKDKGEESLDDESVASTATTPTEVSPKQEEPITPCIYRLGYRVEQGWFCVEQGCFCVWDKVVKPPLRILALGTGVVRTQCDICYCQLYGYCGSWKRMKLGPLMNIDVCMRCAKPDNYRAKVDYEDTGLHLMDFWKVNIESLTDAKLKFATHSSRKPPSWIKRWKEYRLKKAIISLYRSNPPNFCIFSYFRITYNLFCYYCHLRHKVKTSSVPSDGDREWWDFFCDWNLFDATLFPPDSDEETISLAV